jgi:hypothetical protein
MLTLLHKGVIFSFLIFLIQDFFDLPPVLITPVVHLELPPRIFEKPKVENLVTLSLLKGDLFFRFFLYFIQHCFVCGPSYSTVSEELGSQSELEFLKSLRGLGTEEE